MAGQTWNERELRILTALVEMFDAGGAFIGSAEIEAKTGLGEEAVQRGLRALMSADPELIGVYEANTFGGPWIGAVNYVTAAARQVVGTWPTSEGQAEGTVRKIHGIWVVGG